MPLLVYIVSYYHNEYDYNTNTFSFISTMITITTIITITTTIIMLYTYFSSDSRLTYVSCVSVV